MKSCSLPLPKHTFGLLLFLLTLLGFGLSGCGGNTSSSSGTTSSSTTVLTATATSATVGTSIAFTATVTPAATSGTVTFLDGTTTLGTGTVSSGQATYTTTALSTGSHSITASFGGNGSYTSSTSSALAITITAAAATSTTTTLGVSASTAVVGSAITLTGTVAPSAATGTITFYDGTTSIGTGTIASGVATASTSALATGTHSLTAVYGGSTSYATSTSSAVSVTITGAGTTATTTTLTSSATSLTSGSSVTLTATVAPAAATGIVTFYSGTTSLGTGTLSSGTASLATTALPVGTDSVTAVYGSDTNYTASTSSAVTITVTAATSSTSCSSQTGDAQILCLAQAFYATLTTTQQAAILLTYNLTNAEHWSNLPVAVVARQGVKLGDLTTAQLAAAAALMQAALSTDGYTRFQGIRAADGYIATVSSMFQWGYGNYYIAFVGTPSSSSAWQLQFSGHHDSVNITFNGNYTSATPYFIGVEPATSFTYSGTTYTAQLEKQRAAMYALNQTLTSNSSAALSGTFDDVVEGVGSTGTDGNYPITYPSGTTGRGVLYASLTTAQQADVKTAIEAWVNDLNSTEATALLAIYEDPTALASTYVGYSGTGTLTTNNDYIRIDGPRVWIEFVVQQGVAFPTTYHYHSIWRDKTADYGGDF